MNQEEKLLIAVHAAIEAGHEILEIYKTDFAIESKEDRTPLTAADKRSHEVISSMLSKTGIPELSEEGRHLSYGERANWESLWIVDPLDGTKEFIKRNGEFTVNIALVTRQKPILGVIYIPVTRELYFSLEHLGAFKAKIDDENRRFSDITELTDISDNLPYSKSERPFTVVCSRSHLSSETQEYIDALKQDHSEIEYASKGSSLKFCLIAEGLADIYPRFAPTMEWDTAAGQAIVEACGGRVVRHDSGEKLQYNKEDLLNPWFIVYS